MQLTDAMVDAFVARAGRVLDMAAAGQTEIKVIGGERYVLALCYVAALGTSFSPTNFGLVPPDIEAIRRDCDPERLATLPAEWVNDPILVCGPGVSIIDGNHRIVTRWDRGERLIPAYRVPDETMAIVHQRTRLVLPNLP